MQILAKPFGEYQTNCYIVKNTSGEIIIDPGIGATNWVIEQVSNPFAILNTHGHFDHVWSNAEVQKNYIKNQQSIPIVCPFADSFMLVEDCFNTGLPTSVPNIEVFKDLYPSREVLYDKGYIGHKEVFKFGNFEVSYQLFPGHTPGCSIITIIDLEECVKQDEIKEAIFSGDFIFYRSIGRSDFPYSSREIMKESLMAFEKLEGDSIVFPGHGQSTTLKSEQKNIPYWISRV